MSHAEPAVQVSVVIPVYNAADTLLTLADELVQTLSSEKLSFELIFVDDGSGDASWGTIQAVREKYPDRVFALRLMRNFGQHNALMCGLRQSHGQVVVTLDDDMQHPPSEIPKLLRALAAAPVDVVYGAPADREHTSWRNFGSATLNFFFRLALQAPVSLSAFRAIRSEVVQSILSYDLNYTFIDGLLAWNTTRIIAVEVRHNPRQRGQSGYSFGRLVTLAVNLMTNFSLLPLQVVSLVGFITATLGFCLGLWYLMNWLLSPVVVVPGFATTIIAILVLGGVQLLGLGIIGEYLGRMHLNINRKPQYVVREALAPENDDLGQDFDPAHVHASRVPGGS